MDGVQATDQGTGTHTAPSRRTLKDALPGTPLTLNTNGVALSEDVARSLCGILKRGDSITISIAAVATEQQKLVDAERRLSVKIETFRTKKETIKAQYTAAEAQVKISESVSGISEEMADIGITVERAETKTEEMKARSSALDELIEMGTLEDITGKPDDIEAELSKISASSEIEEKLARLKAGDAA